MWVLMFPGIVAALTAIPVMALGPIAFAVRADIELSTADIGVAFSSFFLCSALFASAGGWLVVRFPASAVARVGTLCSAGVCVVLGVAEVKPLLLAACLVGGMVNGAVTPSLNILITRVVPDRRWGLAFGIKAAAAPAAASLAASGAYAAASSGFSWRHMYWMCAAAGVVVVAASRGLDSGPPSRSPVRVPRRRVRPRLSLKILGAGGLLGSTGSSVLTPYLADGLIAQGEPPGRAAGLLAVSGWLAITARIIVGVFSDRSPDPLTHLRAAALLLLGGSIGMVGLATGGTFPVLLVATLVAFGLGWAWPGLVHHAALATHPENPAGATSYMQTGTFLGALLGPLGFGFVAAHGSFTLAWSISAASALLACGFMLATVRQLEHGAAS
ncbi:MFS transporter [Pseudofrankia sp. BMG5.37]|nr:MFS transporter [Pseudofrankia sp. BMG5.37]MDT3444926.1 MFS transporter [Pseudofrankia sp. BMG5.37]